MHYVSEKRLAMRSRRTMFLALLSDFLSRGDTSILLNLDPEHDNLHCRG